MNTTTGNDNDPKSYSGIDFKSGGVKGIVITIIVGLLLITILWVWKSIQIKNIKEQAAEERLQLNEKDRNLMRDLDESNLNF
ncbi:hypothetical protein [Niastella populi]|uniref:Uncharacterized protein n=1 Tax=Niastella populi TaxID=550983 RepID=A0A1V9FKV7_9BACT|nr:hypothetical protein [Niastella populi]OQP58927.1 hypothetical protein A4R26_22370 [Niastella populi]